MLNFFFYQFQQSFKAPLHKYFDPNAAGLLLISISNGADPIENIGKEIDVWMTIEWKMT